MGKRLFAAIDLPEATRTLLKELDPEVHGVRWTTPEQMHLTLGFFGSVDEEVEIALRAKFNTIEFGAFFLPLTGIGTFPSKGPPRIIWIGVGKGHPHLFQIHKRIQDAALAVGLEADLRPWHPHITLGRCRDIVPQFIRNFVKSNRDLDFGLIRVDAFHLYASKLGSTRSVHTRQLTVGCRTVI